MTYPLRVEEPGGFYHVTARGNDGQPIFPEDVARELLLTLLARVVDCRGWICHAYCLMGNHYHLLLETPEPNLAIGMQQLNGAYALLFNRRYGRRGHLFERRYAARLIESEQHSLEIVRYIVLNPVRAGLCATAADWRWSSYRAAAGLCKTPRFLTCTWLLGQFDRDPVRAREHFAEFVAEGVPAASLDGLLLTA